MPHKSRLAGFIIDCQSPDDLGAVAAFWGAALGLAPRADAGDKKYVRLHGDGDGLSIEVQRVEHEPRVHLDIETDDIPAEVARLERLGATVARDMGRWVVMRAPTGHHFCVVRPQRPDFAERAAERQ